MYWFALAKIVIESINNLVNRFIFCTLKLTARLSNQYRLASTTCFRIYSFSSYRWTRGEESIMTRRLLLLLIVLVLVSKAASFVTLPFIFQKSIRTNPTNLVFRNAVSRSSQPSVLLLHHITISATILLLQNLIIRFAATYYYETQLLLL